MSKDRVAIYCRLSKEDEAKLDIGDNSASIENQKLLLMEYAIDQNWTIHKTYSDDDRKGFDRDRPAFNELLRDAQAGLFNIVLCKHQSRFTRDMELVERYLHHEFVLWGIRFVSVVDHVDTNAKGGKKARQINGLINEWYSEDLSENIRAVFRAKMLDGQYLGSFACYGFVKDPQDRHKLIADPDTATIVAEIFALYLQGNGCAKIAALLTQRGIPTPSAYKAAKNLPSTPHASKYSIAHGIWPANTIRKILTNQMYLGHMVQGRERKLSYKSKKTAAVPPSEWIIVRNTHAPLIDEQTFQTVQTLIARRRTIRNPPAPAKTAAAHPFAGRIRCKDCGAAMHKGSLGRDGQTYHLRCRLANKTRSIACTPHSIKLNRLTDAVENAVRTMIRGFLSTPNGIQAVQDTLCNATDTKKDLATKARSLQNITSRIQSETACITAAYKDKLAGLLTNAEFSDMKSALHAEIKTLKTQQTQIEQDIQTLALYADATTLRAENLFSLTDFETLTHEIVNDFIDFIEIGAQNADREQEIVIHWLF